MNNTTPDGIKSEGVSWYVIVKYVPDPVIDECVNVGIIAYDEQAICTHVLKNWKRAEAFAGVNLDRVKETVEHMLSASILTRDGIKAMADWYHSIQITEPRASIEHVARLCEETAKRFLVERD